MAVASGVMQNEGALAVGDRLLRRPHQWQMRALQFEVESNRKQRVCVHEPGWSCVALGVQGCRLIESKGIEANEH